VITTTGRPLSFRMDDSTMVGEVRRATAAFAGTLGFDDIARGQAAIIATEAATNLCKHATRGEIVIQGLESGTVTGIDILALDKGPGMDNVGRYRTDGFSTAGSPGTGLGAMTRLSAQFDIHSVLGIGTTTLARIWSERPPPATGEREFGVVSLPVAGEEVCGDHWAIGDAFDRTTLLIVDGLGHGPQAAEAAREAVRIFGENVSLGPAAIIQAAHGALRSTRGAALAIAQLDPERGEVRFAGVGNIAGSVLDPAEGRSTSLVSYNGIVGHTIRKVQEFTYPWAPGFLLVMHSDGLGSQWQMGQYAGLALKHPGLIAGTLYRDFKRERDDVTVVAVREGSASRR
jgi:anti-sigma regulatory factor (Ser/Thr protein kinase)